MKSPKQTVKQKEVRIETLGDVTIGSPSTDSQILSLPLERIIHWCISEGPAGNGRHPRWGFENNLVMGLGAGLRKPTIDGKTPKD